MRLLTLESDQLLTLRIHNQLFPVMIFCSDEACKLAVDMIVLQKSSAIAKSTVCPTP